jgi:ADP-ribose pyrophosphatase YjhB (NUDIX family)
MKKGRHFTASVFIVNQGKVLLHKHKRFGVFLPVGGYLEKEELPHQAAKREAKEESGLDIEIFSQVDFLKSERLEEIPRGGVFKSYKN